jgi:membrane peptidoglycan carboxypeptidase
MRQRKLVLLLIILCLLTTVASQPSLAQRRRRASRARSRPAPTRTTTTNDGCDLRFAGSYRKQVKLRPTNLDYTFHNSGRAITVTDWLAFTCSLDPEVPLKSNIPATTALAQERVKIKLRGFLMAVKRDPDNDLHVQIAERARPYNQSQIIIEIPPGQEFCAARSKMAALTRADGGTVNKHIFARPPEVEATGYLFIDGTHMEAHRGDYCAQNGGRGIKGSLSKSPVRGIWELHPVIKLEDAH